MGPQHGQEKRRPRFSLDSRAGVALLITVMVAVIGVLILLGLLSRPEASPGQPTPPLTQISLPLEHTQPPAATQPAATPDSVEIVVGPLVAATNYAPQARLFDEQQALEHLAVLTSDEMGGRQSGTPGGRAAADYIAARFAEYGLQPAGVDATYFQTLSVPSGQVTELPVLAVTLPGGRTLPRTYAYRDDYYPFIRGYLGPGEAEGQVVWMNECLDYAGQDMVGKIILCHFDGNPEVYRRAIEHQVGGLLLLAREREVDHFLRGGYRDTFWVDQTLPAYFITENVAEDLLIGTDYTLNGLSLRFAITPLSTTVRMAVAYEEDEQAEARNVLGLLPGSDPDLGDEVVIVGAHFDHMGREPDGAVMAGANDNASGVATILEIARLWQAQGYRPARSVLFAAWDGEEVGLLGSAHYVAHPTLPLTRTVSMINLDMVGVGDHISIDGDRDVAIQLDASTEMLGDTATLGSGGGSDHVPFLATSISAAALGRGPDWNYHSTGDQFDAIDPQILKASGVIAAHTLSVLAGGNVELERTIERMEAAIAAGDREAFLAGIDSTNPDLQAAQALWFDSLWSREVEDVSIAADWLRLGDGEADVYLSLSYRWVDTSRRETPVSRNARFVERDGVWVYAGDDLATVSDDGLVVSHFPDESVSTARLLTITRRAYLTLVDELGSEPVSPTHVIYYPSVNALRAIADPAADQAVPWLISSAGQVHIARTDLVTTALVNLILDQMGLPPGAASWLREGLVAHYTDRAEQDDLPVLISTEPSVSLLDYPSAGGLAAAQAETLRAFSWSATEYLLEEYSAAVLDDLCAAWGETSDPSGAFERVLGLTPDQFESAWRADSIDPLRADAAAIQSTIEARAAAVLARDATAFLDTVSRRDPLLRDEERSWFAAQVENPAVDYALRGEFVALSPREGQAVVELNVTTVLSDGQQSRVRYNARFVREGGRWLYAGLDWNELAGDHIVLKYQGHDSAWARHTVDLLEEVYAQVTADLGVSPPLPLEIKVYDGAQLYRALISDRAASGAGGRNGRAIHLLEGDGSDAHLRTVAAHALALQLLDAQGVRADWLREGVADFEAGRTYPLDTHWMAGMVTPILQPVVRRHDEFSLFDLPSLDEVPEDDAELFQAQSLSIVSFIAEQGGLSGLRRFIARSVASDDVSANLRAALGVDPDVFARQWQAQVYSAQAQEEWVALTHRFDPERALEHIAFLSSPALSGRAAGTEGADRAAAYIAEQFAALGLEPLGDPLTVTEDSPLGYLQSLAISSTRVISVPTLTLLDSEGREVHTFTYGQDFVERGGTGTAEGTLVWLRTRDVERMYLTGTVVIAQTISQPASFAADLARRGAGGLLVVNEGGGDDPYQVGSSGATLPIPVFELTDDGFETLLESVEGLSLRDLDSSPPALPLDVRIEQALLRPPLTTTLTANVLGFLPGSDPDLAAEVLVVGAHYDHIGQLPDGRHFPGANRNGSGVGAMLEMLRVWQAEGYHPARSILFAAWGAEELESAGVGYYLDHPAVPLTQTAGVIALDSIAGGEGYRLLFYGTREHDLPLMVRCECAVDVLGHRALRRGATGGGWHVPFNRAGIPTLKLIWDDAESSSYQLTDTVDAIDVDRLASSGQVLTLFLAWLASP